MTSPTFLRPVANGIIAHGRQEQSIDCCSEMRFGSEGTR